MYTYTHTYTYTFIQTHIHTLHTYMYTYQQRSSSKVVLYQKRIYMCTYVCVCVRVYVHIYICMYVYKFICIYVCSCMYIHMYTNNYQQRSPTKDVSKKTFSSRTCAIISKKSPSALEEKKKSHRNTDYTEIPKSLERARKAYLKVSHLRICMHTHIHS